MRNEELHNWYICQVRSMKWAGHVARIGETRKPCRILVGKPERKNPPGRPRCSWEEIGWGSMDWIDLAQDRDQWRAGVNTVINLRLP
jgi:hypothetical protein